AWRFSAVAASARGSRVPSGTAAGDARGRGPIILISRHINILPSIMDGEPVCWPGCRARRSWGWRPRWWRSRWTSARGSLPYAVVGLPDAGVREARERVRAAVRNSGDDVPITLITGELT